MKWIVDIAQAAGSLGLKKSGGEYKGPCPNCGGNDRFWLAKGRVHPILASCRGCDDFAGIAKAIKAAGLAVDDDQFDPSFQLQKKREEQAQKDAFFIHIYERAKESGEHIHYADHKEYKNAKFRMQNIS